MFERSFWSGGRPDPLEQLLVAALERRVLLHVRPLDDAGAVDEEVGAVREEALLEQHAVLRDTSRLKSLRNSDCKPSFRLNSLSVGTESTLTGRTTTSAVAKWSHSSRMSHSSSVQVLVKASGKKARSTARPRSDERVTASRSWRGG